MSSQKVVWTALPNGFVGSGPANGLKLSVFIAPRLHPTSGNLLGGPFLDWLDWPQSVRSVGFSVQLGDGSVVPAHPDLTPLDSVLWKALFTPHTLVRPHALDDYASKFVMSYPIKNVIQYVHGKYQQLALRSPTASPDPGFLKTYLQDFLNPRVMGMDDKAVLGQAQDLLARYRQVGGIPAFGDVDPHRDLLLLRLYHLSRTSAPPPSPTAPTFDFHQAVTALGQHPAVMRKLGLVVDLQIPNAAALAHNTELKIVPHWTGHIKAGAEDGVPATLDMTPFTAYNLNATAFMARPRDKGPQTIVNGFLNMSDQGPYSLAEIDPDGAGLKLSFFAMELQRRQKFNKAGVLPAVRTLPALKSAGISIIESGAGQNTAGDFHTATSTNSAMEGGSKVTLHAEDLVRGYAIDVWDGDTGAWHSLNRRKMRYQFLKAPASKRSLTVEDEGAVTLAMTQKPGDSPSTLNRRESLFRWEGWSLVAPLPSAAIDPNDKPTTDSSGNPVRPLNTPLPNFPMQSDPFVVPGSLPRLRFGTKYRVRARVIDLAGNSVPYNSPDARQALPGSTAPAFTYHRYEPVPAPQVILAKPLGSPLVPFAGESVMHVVVRSDVGVNAHDYVAYLAAKGFPGYLEDALRHVVPPRGSAQMAEHHRAWDLGFGVNVNALTTMKNFDSDFPSVAVGGGNMTENRTQIFPHDDNAVTPYLPDIPSRGAALNVTSGPPGIPTLTNLPFTGTWPALNGFRVHLIGVPDGTPTSWQWDSTSRILQVRLAQGDEIDIDLSSQMSASDLQLLGVWQWIADANPPNLPFLRGAALKGLHRMLTPATLFTLVHAVQHPLITPNFNTFHAVPRPIGGTVATLTEDTGMPVSGKSTHLVEVHADWQEPVDDVAQPAPGVVNHSQSVSRLDVDIAQTTMEFSVQHTFPDTKYRKVDYKPLATSRFRGYLPFTDAQIEADPTLITVSGNQMPLDILSSARPDAPEVLYVVPTWHWASSTHSEADGTHHDVNRFGMRLRVYLKRPWYSSGDGEKLGVMLLPPAAGHTFTERVARVLKAAGLRLNSRVKTQNVDPDLLSHYFTQWASDPLWGIDANHPISGAPSLTNFPFATATRQNVTIDELPGVQLDVAGHDVQFDAARKLWYSDILVNAPTGSPVESAYYPFVRMALARFQPNSVSVSIPGAVHTDVYVSRIRMADFAQLTPNRLATVIPAQDKSGNPIATVQVQGVGYVSSAYQPATPAPTPGSTMVVHVQQSDANTSDPVLTWSDVTDPTTLQGETRDGVNMLWSGQVHLPSAPGAGTIRLVITESETYPDINNQFPSTRIVYAAQYVL